MSEPIKLLPCPFCGGDSLGHGYSAPPEQGTAECFDCHVVLVADSEPEAIAGWNRRGLPPPPETAP